MAPLTLIGSLCGFRDVDSKLAMERVDAHHASVHRAVCQTRELVVGAWYIVECLSDVSCPLQNDLLS